jgi:hypothetical protein
VSDINVIVYREEEVIKVLIHELIHALGIDYAHTFMSDTIEHDITTMFHTQKPLRINESFTDTWACIIHTCIYASLHKQLYSRTVFTKCLRKEMDYIAYKGSQIAQRVLDMYKENGIWSERTHVVSYYLLKAINFENLEEFIDTFTKEKGKGNILISKGSLEMYVQWFKKHIHDNQIHTIVQSSKNISTKRSSFKGNQSIQPSHTSLRMTSLDCMQFILTEKNKLFKSIVA